MFPPSWYWEHGTGEHYNSAMPETKKQTFAVTHRPKDGVTDSDVSALVNYCRRVATYYKVITEKDGHERHLHAALFMKEPVYKKVVVRAVLNLYPNLRDEEKMVLRQGVKVSGNSQWLDYLEKGDSTVVIANNLPEVAHLESYYPPPEQLSGKVRKNITYYARLENLWYEHVDPGKVKNPVNCRHFLFDMMYAKRLIDVIRDDKSIIQVSRHLARYLNRVSESCLERMVENLIDDDV